MRRGRRIAGVIVMSGLIWGCGGWITTPPAGPRVLVLGDSLTMQFGPPFAVYAAPTDVITQWWPGTNPVAVSWLQWMNNISGRLDTVVMEDYTGVCCDMGGFDADSYTAAVQALADAAHARGARFVVLDTTEHPDLSAVTGIDALLPMVAPDDPDGVHYLDAGADSEGRLLAEQLGLVTTTTTTPAPAA